MFKFQHFVRDSFQDYKYSGMFVSQMVGQPNVWQVHGEVDLLYCI